MAISQLDPLTNLLQASSKSLVVSICNDVFQHHERNSLPESLVKTTAESLNIDTKQSRQLLISLSCLLRKAVFSCSTDPECLLALFPENFNKNLKDLLIKIIIESYPKWKSQVMNKQVSLPHLIDLDWCVDLKTSTSTISTMSVPTCIVQFKMQNLPTQSRTVPGISSMNMELSKETLDTMLNGLTKIRDQLLSVTKQQS